MVCVWNSAISERHPTYSVEEHAMADARLHILRPGVARVLAQESPRACLTVVSVQPTELWLRRPTVFHTGVARQDAAAKRVDHVLL